MAKLAMRQEDFEISITLNGANKTIHVKPDETSDGVEYFKCSEANKNITQIRQEKDGSWEQIWGELDIDMVQEIGKAISTHPR